MYADLHNHTTHSDGTDTPLELCRLAAARGLRVISITDHDSVGAYAELRGAARPLPVDIIPGIELSIEADHVMIHILGYSIDVLDPGLTALLARMAIEKTESTRLNFERAVEQGIFDFEWARVLAHGPARPRIGGVHVVAAMEAAGAETNIPGMSLWKMFRTVFWPAEPEYISVSTVSAQDAIEAILRARGVPVLAHPGQLGNDALVTELIHRGLRGIEAFHPTHSDGNARRYAQMARDMGLYVTGGSDWHGRNSVRGRTFASHGLEDDGYEILRCGQFF